MDPDLWHIDHSLIGWSRPENSPNMLSDKRQRIVTDLLWSQAERQALREEHYQKKKDSNKRARVSTPFPSSSNFPGSFFDDDKSTPGTLGSSSQTC